MLLDTANRVLYCRLFLALLLGLGLGAFVLNFLEFSYDDVSAEHQSTKLIDGGTPEYRAAPIPSPPHLSNVTLTKDSAPKDPKPPVQSSLEVDQKPAPPDEVPPPGEDSYRRCTPEQRKANVRETCERHKADVKDQFNPNNPQSYYHIMVDDKHKVLYCYVPKASCTSWKHVIALASGEADPKALESNWNIVHEPVSVQMGLRRLSSNSLLEIHRKLKEYTKFMVMRNPFSRIYSAYNDKFISFYKTYAKVYYPGLLQRLYPDLPIVNGERFLSFEKLIDMIVLAHQHREPYLNLAVIDEHWRIVTNMCYPCFIEYDYIGKVETMEEDKLDILPLFNATDLPHEHQNHDRSKETNIFNYTPISLEESFNSLPAKTLQDLINVFKIDFDVFGYSPLKSCGFDGSNKCC